MIKDMHWTFWMGIGFLIAGGISYAIAIGGEGPPSFIEEVSAYSIGWIIFGIGMVVFSFVKKMMKKKQ